ncbi:MAG: glycoside hydrolase family 66 protein [Minisyncoccia bacterium]
MTGETIVVTELDESVTEVLIRTAFGAVHRATRVADTATLTGLPPGTHALEARNADGVLVDEEIIGVRDHPGDDPVVGFVTSFDAASTPGVLEWLTRLRCTVVQVYDWMERYSAPLAGTAFYRDPLGRPIERPELEALIAGITALGATPQAYAPICAADHDFASDHSDLALWRNDGAVESLGDLLAIMDPGSPDWQQHWLDAYGRALDALGFTGLHLDTYGYPRAAKDAQGREVDVAAGYDSFVRAVRRTRPNDVVSFNQVNGVPRDFAPSERPGFRYVEVWRPNDRWSHFEGLLARSGAGGEPQGDTLAVYPPVWSGPRVDALRTVVLTEAVATTLGAGVLTFGDRMGVLSHPYYVNHEELSVVEAEVALRWHRFSLRVRDLFRSGIDTSWYELDDENASVGVSSAWPACPEPVARSLYARVVRHEGVVTVSLLDLSGSADGSWRSATERGVIEQAVVTVLVDQPASWSAEVAVLGLDGDHFVPTELSLVAHREGHALSIDVKLVDGWSVVRVTRGG